MSRPATRVWRLALWLAVSVAVGCSEPSPTPAAPTSAVPSSLTIVGVPTTPSIGQSAQLTARATLADGTSKVVTDGVAWQSSNAAVAAVSTTGLLTVAGSGDADINAV